MSLQSKEMVIGDVVKYELPHELARSKVHITCIPAATVGLVVGEILEPGGAVGQVHTITALAAAPDPSAGTFKLGYKGQWTTAIAFDALVGAVKDAFELLSTVVDTVTVGAQIDTLGAAPVTITWTTAGKKDVIEFDGRELLDGSIYMGDVGVTEPTCLISTGGSTAAESAKILATGANADYILLEKVTLADLKAEANIERAVISKGECIVDGDNLFGLSTALVDAKAALVARGITIRTEPTIYQSGPPTS